MNELELTYTPCMYCAVCGGPLERSEQYPEAGWVHANDSDDTHTPVLPASELAIAGGTCTLCENKADELLPWATRERLCWPCVDLQLDLMAAAIRDAYEVTA